MADEFQLGSGNWPDTSRNRFDTAASATTPSSISTTLNSMARLGWQAEMMGVKSRSTTDRQSSGVLANPDLQMMGLGPSSQGMDWNQALLGERGESSFRTSNFQHEHVAAAGSSDHQDSSLDDLKKLNLGFSLDHQPQFSSQGSSNDSTITSQNLTTGFQVDSSSAYGLLLSDQNQHQQPHHTMNTSYSYPTSGYGASTSEMVPSWNKFPQFLRTSPPKQPLVPSATAISGSHLHFPNNTPFWNASALAATMVGDARSSFFQALQTPIPAAPSFDEKPKSTSEGARDLGATTMKKSSTETSNKRPRSETPSPLPAFKVRKEKMGDRITALQQLVSPFGKTDTASVLSEAFESIKFLHQQVSALSTPYLKNGAPVQHQQNSDKSKDPKAPRQDLRSRGLCLVPVPSTFPMTHETTVDFWTPTFGGSFR